MTFFFEVGGIRLTALRGERKLVAFGGVPGLSLANPGRRRQ
jgi:hypothetical protein